MVYETIYEYPYKGSGILHFIFLFLFYLLGWIKEDLKDTFILQTVFDILGYLFGSVLLLMLIVMIFKSLDLKSYEQELIEVMQSNSYKIVEGSQ